MESLWSKKKIQRLKIVKGEYVWKDVKVFDIMIGDVVKLFVDTVSPADLLILDTSQSRHSEKILYTNEGKITGRSRVIIKTAAKNMSDLRIRYKPNINESTKLREFMSKMNGVIEYEPPSIGKSTVTGTIKLKNDPKVTLFDNMNIVFFGSKLHSEWVIGMVLYNGRNTKILKKNIDYEGWRNSLERRDGFIQRFINGLTIWLALFAIAVSGILFFMMSIQDNRSKVEYIEKF